MLQKERINWIDWAKALAVSTVVFCHLPQSQEWFYYRYLQACIITIFFFLSGYLKKDRGSMKSNWKKYWTSLIVPYVLLNLMVYPYWIVRFYILHGELPGFLEALKPITGMLLMESETTFSEPLNGPLWYLPAILAMHLIVDSFRRMRHFHAIMLTLCALSVVLYAANKYWNYAPYLCVMGFVRRLPYYYLGYVMGQQQLFRNCHVRRDLTYMVLCFAASLIFFHWHLSEQCYPLHIAIFYPVNYGFLFGVLYGCKLLNKYKSDVVVNLSVGTLGVIGLHLVLISGANYATKLWRGLTTGVCYQWYEALPLTIIIVALLYPVILFSLRHFPALLGGKTGCPKKD
jgi:hypothetical protein